MRPMHRKIVPLIGLNAALLGVLGVMHFASESHAQRGNASSEYITIPIAARGTGDREVIVLLDTVKKELAAYIYQRELTPIGTRSLTADMEEQERRTRR